jgi:hypothetical protein
LECRERSGDVWNVAAGTLSSAVSLPASLSLAEGVDFVGSANSPCFTAGLIGGFLKRIGTAVLDERRRSLNELVGRACSGLLVGLVGPLTGSGGSSSGNASSCHGCRPVRRVNSSLLSSMDRCGGVLGRSMGEAGVRYVRDPLSSRGGWGPSRGTARMPGMILSACDVSWAAVSSSGSGVASATALSSKKGWSMYFSRRSGSVDFLAGSVE